MNKRYAAAAVVFLCVAASSLYTWWSITQPLRIHWMSRELRIRDVGWNVPLARVEFNITARMDPEGVIEVEYVQVNGTVVDFYPQSLSLKNGESAIVRVYFAYKYNSTYEFEFIDNMDDVYPVTSTSPLQ